MDLMLVFLIALNFESIAIANPKLAPFNLFHANNNDQIELHRKLFHLNSPSYAW